MRIRQVGVVGCGLMGHGIAQVAAQGGLSVLVYEQDSAALERGIARIEQSLEKLAEKAIAKGERSKDRAQEHVAVTRARILPTLELGALQGSDMIVDAIVENLDAKRQLFEELNRICEPATILASNTSSFSIAELARASGRSDRTIGLHFFNPVQLMQLVEVVRIDETDPAVLDAARIFAKTCGKLPITCKDTPGFVVNRLLVPLMVQAMQMLDRGIATAEDIDTALQLGAGHPMGPITLADYVGLDTTLAILEGWHSRFPEETAFAIPECLREKVEAGKFGRKTGEGFFRWEGDKRA